MENLKQARCMLGSVSVFTFKSYKLGSAFVYSKLNLKGGILES